MENAQYELITGELLETLKGDCQDVVDFAAKNFRVQLAFNDESVVWLSSFIEDQRGNMSAETRQSWSVRIGIFLGFAIIERYGGEERPSIEAKVGYRKKVGMLEEINKVAREIERETKELNDIRQRQMQDESGPMELPVGPAGGGGGPPGAATPAPVPPAPAPTQ